MRDEVSWQWSVATLEIRITQSRELRNFSVSFLAFLSPCLKNKKTILHSPLLGGEGFELDSKKPKRILPSPRALAGRGEINDHN